MPTPCRLLQGSPPPTPTPSWYRTVVSSGNQLATQSAKVAAVNASNVTKVDFDLDKKPHSDGTWALMYQKRVINASQWVNESINASSIQTDKDDEGNLLTGFGLFNPVSVILSLLGISVVTKREDDI